MRKIVFADGEYYHIYNRGVDKRDIFLEKRDYERFLLCIDLLNDEADGLMKIWRDSNRAKLCDVAELSSERNPLVEIIAYCLNPNHFHFIIRQKKEKGVEKFMHKLSTGYTNYFNKKYDRSGSLFQGPFKAIYINSNEYLLYLSAYVNRNNFIHGYSQDDSWPYTSYLDYIGKRSGGLCSKEVILGQFKNDGEYRIFLNVNAEYLKGKKEAEKYLLEE